MNKNLLIVLIVVILGVGGWFLFGTDTANGPDVPGLSDVLDEEEADDHEHGVDDTHDEEMEEMMDEMMGGHDEADVEAVVISFNGVNYEPANVQMSVGNTVRFENNSGSRVMWPASVVHPTHTVYPGSSIGKCGTEEAGDIFDACRALDPGESYSFTFKWVGQWGYHDHLRPSVNGKITVN